MMIRDGNKTPPIERKLVVTYWGYTEKMVGRVRFERTTNWLKANCLG